MESNNLLKNLSLVLEKNIYNFLQLNSNANLINTLAQISFNLTNAFTTNRESLDENYLDNEKNLKAYILNFLPINAQKIFHILNDLHSQNIFSDMKELGILDLGSGPATASLASKIFFDSKALSLPLNITCIDRSDLALKAARELINLKTTQTICSDINHKSISDLIYSQKFDLIFLANFLNELKSIDEKLSLLKHVLSHLNENGVMIIIEPALHESSRALMQLRDLLLQNTDISILAPCTHQNACPMLNSNERDWCHFYIEQNRTSLMNRVDAKTGIDHDLIKMSYLIFSKRAPKNINSSLMRVVSSPIKTKGKLEYFCCNEKNISRLARQDKNASEKNSAFSELKRGDLIECSDQKILKDSSVNIVKKWG